MGIFGGGTMPKRLALDPNTMALTGEGALDAQAPAPQPSGWNKAANIAGTLADGILAAYGQQGAYSQGLQRQQQYGQQMALQQAKALLDDRQRRMAQQDKIAYYDYERANPKQSDDTFTRALAAAGIQEGSPEYVGLARKRAEMLTNPVQLVSDGMGGMVAVRPQSAPSSASAPMHDLPQGYTIRPSAPQAQPQPQVIDRNGYEIMRSSLGDAGVKRWMAQYNVILGGN